MFAVSGKLRSTSIREDHIELALPPLDWYEEAIKICALPKLHHDFRAGYTIFNAGLEYGMMGHYGGSA